MCVGLRVDSTREPGIQVLGYQGLLSVFTCSVPPRVNTVAVDAQDPGGQPQLGVRTFFGSTGDQN